MGKPNPFAENSFEWYWYEWWLGPLAALVALGILIYVWATSDSRGRGTTLNALAALAFAGTTPLALERIGVGVAVQEGSMAAFSFLGSAGSVLLAVFNFVTLRRRGPERPACSAR